MAPFPLPGFTLLFWWHPALGLPGSFAMATPADAAKGASEARPGSANAIMSAPAASNPIKPLRCTDLPLRAPGSVVSRPTAA